jgi:hypothetical protein
VAREEASEDLTMMVKAVGIGLMVAVGGVPFGYRSGMDGDEDSIACE